MILLNFGLQTEWIGIQLQLDIWNEIIKVVKNFNFFCLKGPQDDTIYFLIETTRDWMK